MILGLAIAAGVLVLVGAIVSFVFAMVRAERAKVATLRHKLEAEGIRLDAGAVDVTIRMRNFRAPGMYEGRGIQGTRRHLVLTDQQLAILGGRPAFFTPRSELKRWKVGLDGERLHLVSDDPPGATGHVDLRISVPDALQWVTTLREAGCTLIE